MREDALFPNFPAKALPASVTVPEVSPEHSTAADGEVTLG